MNRNHLLYKAFHPNYKPGHSLLKKLAIFGIAITIVIVIIVLIVKSKKLKNENNINDKINGLKESNNKLQTEINSLNSEISELTKKSSELKEQIEKLKKQQNENTDNKELNEKYSSLEKEFKELEGQEKELNSQIEKSETENKSSEDKIKELKEKLSSLQKEKENSVKPTSSLADTVILTDDNINSILDIFNTKLNFNLLYRASRDGKEYSDFKSKVGSHKNLLIIGKTDTNLVLGGYTINNLEGNGFVKDKFAFLYNFKKDKKFKVKNENEALYLKEGNFPCFGDDDITFGPGKQKSKFPKSYKY